MSKYSKKTKVVPTEVNQMGEKAFALSPEEELVSTVLTTFVQKSYYESENEIVTRIKNAASKCDPKFVAQVAIYTREEGNMRSSSHLLAGEVATRVSGLEWGKRFFEAIVVRPDDIAEITGYVLSQKRKITHAMRKGFSTRMSRFDAYLLDKYRMGGRAISMVDLVRFYHPKPTQKNAEAFRRLVAGESLEGLYTTKMLDREKSKAGQTGQVTKAEVIKDVLDTNVGKSPIFNLVRNLVDIIKETPEKVDEVVETLTNREKIKKSRMLPFRFAAAYAEVEKVAKTASFSSVVFEKGDKDTEVKKVLDALENAMNIACENIPKFEGNTAILIDHSGSVRGDMRGSGKVAPFSTTTTANIGNLFGCMLMQAQDNVYMGLFGDRLIRVENLDRKKGILANNAASFSEGARCGGSTENGLYLFLEDCIANKVRVDNLFIFSDMVIGNGGRGGWDASSRHKRNFQTLFADFRKLNPQCNTVSVDIHQTKGTSVFDASMNVTQVAGWSERIFEICKGKSGYEELIKKIKKIKI